jgi:hypothetical protein
VGAIVDGIRMVLTQFTLVLVLRVYFGAAHAGPLRGLTAARSPQNANIANQMLHLLNVPLSCILVVKIAETLH